MTDLPRTEAGKTLLERYPGKEHARILALIEIEAVRNILTTMRDDLRLLDPDSLPVPIGRVRRKWWRHGMLSGWAVAADLIDRAIAEDDR